MLVHVKDRQWVVICEPLKVDDEIFAKSVEQLEAHLCETTSACLPILSTNACITRA